MIFNQPVGESMSKALREVVKMTQLRNGGWPKGFRIELAFEEKYSEKDGPSASVACGLLLDALITGKQSDPLFAVTGDLNADGEVQPIGGVPAKIRGATNGSCKFVALPSKNETSLPDLLLLDGPAPFAGIQVFSIARFDDAAALAAPEKSGDLKTAIDLFTQIQQVLNRDRSQIGAWLHNAFVVNKLRDVLKAAPNHMSAKYLLLYAEGRAPTTISLSGSIDGIETDATGLVAAIKNKSDDPLAILKKDGIADSISRLKALRPRCDLRTRPYADALIRFGEVVRDVKNLPPSSKPGILDAKRRINGSADAVQGEWNKLIGDPKILEELKQ